MSRAIDGPRTGDATFLQRTLSSGSAVVPSGALTQPKRLARGGPVDGVAAFGLVPRRETLGLQKAR